MTSVMNIANYAIMVVLCHIAKIAGLKMPREPISAPIVNSPYMTRVAGALAEMGAMGRNARKRNALDSPMAVLSSEYSSVCFF
jgi:hypothetical protein